MLDTAAPPLDRPRRFHFDWLLPALFRPRRTFAHVAEHANDAWLTPLLVITLAEIARVLAVGNVRQALAATGQVTLPPDFQFWPPSMQEQFMQAQQATSSPVFLYFFPAFLAVAGVWIGWLVFAGLLHLVLTMLGGRSPTRNTLNVVAWASLPFAVRSLVRAGYALATQSLIGSPGLSGFVVADGTLTSTFLREALILVDIYLVWHLLLTLLGARLVSGLPWGKVVGGVLVTLLLVLLLQALPGLAFAQLGGLQVVRPFF
jgi:hypothetical protein